MPKKEREYYREKAFAALYKEAADYSSVFLKSDDPAVIASCMTVLELFDIEEKFECIETKMEEIYNAETAHYNNNLSIHVEEKT